MTDPSAPLTSSEVETRDPRANLIHAAQQCAYASAQLLLHHIEEGQANPPSRFEPGDLIDLLVFALRTACMVEQDALDHVIERATADMQPRPSMVAAVATDLRSELGQLAAACSKYLGR